MYQSGACPRAKTGMGNRGSIEHGGPRIAGIVSCGLMAVVGLVGCKKTESELPDDPRNRRSTEITLEGCALDSESASRLDPNEDGKAEVVQVMEGEREVCRAVDLNFDGTYDRITFFDQAGKTRRVESDYDRDGRIDEIALYEDGQLQEKHRATTLDGKLDTWDFYENGRIAASERDEDGDGIIDQWWEYPDRGCPLIHIDADGDGRPDPGASIDYCEETGYVPPERAPEIEEGDPGYGRPPETVEEVSNVAADQAAQGEPPEGAAPGADDGQNAESDGQSPDGGAQ